VQPLGALREAGHSPDYLGFSTLFQRAVELLIAASLEDSSTLPVAGFRLMWGIVCYLLGS